MLARVANAQRVSGRLREVHQPDVVGQGHAVRGHQVTIQSARHGDERPKERAQERVFVGSQRDSVSRVSGHPRHDTCFAKHPSGTPLGHRRQIGRRSPRRLFCAAPLTPSWRHNEALESGKPVVDRRLRAKPATWADERWAVGFLDAIDAGHHHNGEGDGRSLSPVCGGSSMPKAVVVTQYGPPDVLAWKDVPMARARPRPGAHPCQGRGGHAHRSGDPTWRPQGRVPACPGRRSRVRGGLVSSTPSGRASRESRRGTKVASMLARLGGYGEYALASSWTPKPPKVSWSDAAALPASAGKQLWGS